MKLYNTLIGRKEEFQPPGGEVRMYVCGPNLYGPCHLGHALSYVFFDTLRRYLEYQGHQVRHVQNFTDIEDHIIEVALQENRSIGELSEHFIQRFLQEMDALGVQRAHHYPRATENITEMVEIIQALIGKGHAYAADGDVYFRVRSFPDYGHLSRRPLEEMMTGTRIEVDPRKEDPLDFVLWKAAKPGEPSWESPWGPGRPGWHIECTTMSLSLLGDHLDIHGGGQDVVFPHHENEIAQSEAYTGNAPFVRFWVHNGLLHPTEAAEEKMTRHQGNFVSCQEALALYHPDAIRLFLLSSHYRSPLAYSEEGLAAQERAVERLCRAVEPTPTPEGASSPLDASIFQERFLAAMDDDLNTPQALAALFDLGREINRGREQGLDVEPARLTLLELAGVLGLRLDEQAQMGTAPAGPLVELLIQVRDELRSITQYALADRIRDRLHDLGIDLEDTSQGTQWRRRSSL